MDVLDRLMLRRAQAALQRHSSSSVDRRIRVAAGLLTRKAHPWVDSRPSEDQAAFAGRGRLNQGLALWLPSLSDRSSIAQPAPSIAVVPHPTRPHHRWRTSRSPSKSPEPHRSTSNDGECLCIRGVSRRHPTKSSRRVAPGEPFVATAVMRIRGGLRLTRSSFGVTASDGGSANARPSRSSTARPRPAHRRQRRSRHAVPSRVRAAFAIATDQFLKSAESIPI
jgi:hypothetical protein